VLVLLPPSEGKAAPLAGPPLSLPALAFGALTPQRERLLGVLERLARGSRQNGLARLGIGPGLAGELERNATLRTAPTAPAAAVYTGVLFQHLDLASLAPDARARAGERLLVASALWGVVRLDDRIPAYRLSMGAQLPRLGGLAAWWRPALTKALPRDGLVVDLRSQAYAAAWQPPEGTTVTVRVFTERDGARTVVSHMAKAARGDVARLLVSEPGVASTPQDVAAAAGRAGLRVELAAPVAAGRPWTLDVLVPG
jgi:uncharacterized protein